MENRILVIAEKKSLAVDIANVLGKPVHHGSYLEVGRYDVTWASGHLLQQQSPEDYDPNWKRWRMSDLPIMPAQQQKIVKRDRKTGAADRIAKSQLSAMKDLLKNASLVINAGDPDREGQIIIDEILDYLKCRLPAKRLWLHAQTPGGIREALGKMKDNAVWKPLSLAAECRAEADWVIGMTCTRGYTLAWQSKGHEGVMNVGRVKSPVIGLIVQRELDIESFVPKAFYIVKASIKTRVGDFIARWQPPEPATDGFDAEGRLIDRKIAQAIVEKTQTRMGTIVQAKKARMKQPPPLLFALGDLQRLAHSFGYSPDRTLEIAQSLYDKHKLTTYPRTTCSYAPESEWARAPQVLASVKANFGPDWNYAGEPDTTRKSRVWNDSKLEAHFGIIPTDMRRDLSALSHDELTIYRLIVAQWLAQFYPDYEYDSTTLTAEVEGERFSATGQTPAIEGWRVIIPLKNEQADDDSKQRLPAVAQGDPCRANPVLIVDDMTRPPPRFNGASLLEAMEKAWKFVVDPKVKARLKETEGIGTPATRSTIIAEVISGGFMTEEKVGKAKVYVPTQKARAYYRALDGDLAKVDLTAYFEGQLEEVAQGRMDQASFKQMLGRFVVRVVAKLKDGSIAAAMPTPDQIPSEPQKGRRKAASGSARNAKAAPTRRSTGQTEKSEQEKKPRRSNTAKKTTSAAQPRSAANDFLA